MFANAEFSCAVFDETERINRIDLDQVSEYQRTAESNYGVQQMSCCSPLLPCAPERIELLYQVRDIQAMPLCECSRAGVVGIGAGAVMLSTERDCGKVACFLSGPMRAGVRGFGSVLADHARERRDETKIGVVSYGRLCSVHRLGSDSENGVYAHGLREATRRRPFGRLARSLRLAT